MLCLHRKYRDFSLIAVLSKFLFMSVFVCHRTSVCLFSRPFVFESLLMLLRQEVENLPPHLAGEFCNRVPHFMSKDGREEKKKRGGNVTTCCSLQSVGKRRAVHDLTV